MNRIGAPHAVRQKRKLKEFEVVHRQNGNLLALQFKDKHDVTMLSSFHEPTVSVLTRQRHGTDEHIRKPGCIVDYTKKMGGVDLCDYCTEDTEVVAKTFLSSNECVYGQCL